MRLAQRTPYGFVTWNHGVHAEAMNGTEFASLMERRGREVLIAASRGLPAALRHRRDSPSSDEAVGGFASNFERVWARS